LNLHKKINVILELKIVEIVNLQKLNLSNNQLTSISNGIGNLVNRLYLNNNQLTSLPVPRAANEIGNMVNLRILHMDYGQFKLFLQESI
jgi:hypothetical protein